MEFRLFGPLEVSEGDHLLPVGGGKRRALLAILLLHAGEVVSRDRLLEELWPEGRSRTAEVAVTVYVSELRKALEPGRPIVTRGPGYAIEISPDQLDVRRFERLVEEGWQALERAEAQTASGLVREALVLRRGPPLADFTYLAFSQAEIGRLDELRLVALELRVEADLALGRAAHVVGELDALIAEHPLRERLRRQKMLALYRCGRQAEALETYAEMRRTLVDELGIEPSRELQELEGQILRQDPALEEPGAAGSPAARIDAPVKPRPGRRAAGAFVGREPELEELEAGLDDALSGRGRLFLLVGQAGIGKSRLADELASRAKERGARVLWSRGWESGGAPELWPWVQLLRSYLRGRDPETLRCELGQDGDELTHLVPELRRLFPELPEPATLDSDDARFRLFDSVRAFFVRAAELQPLMLVLDDLQAADPASLLLLQFLADEVAEARLLVLAASRDLDQNLLDDLARHGLRRLVLGALPASDRAAR